MIVTLAEMKEQLGITPDMGSIDDNLINGKLAAAQNYVESLLGFQIEETYPPAGDPAVSTVPPALKQAVMLTAADWYENRESNLVGVAAQELPHGVWAIVNEFREWSF